MHKLSRFIYVLNPSKKQVKIDVSRPLFQMIELLASDDEEEKSKIEKAYVPKLTGKN